LRDGSRCRRLGAATLTRPADVAQLVEHFTRNEGVRGSSPRVGFGHVSIPREPREGPLSLLDRDPGGQGESLAVARSEAARIRLRGRPCAAGMTTERSRHDRPAVVACVRDGGPMSGERRRRLGVLLAAGIVALVTALTAWGSASTPAAADAQRGGTLRLLGTGDI